VIEPLHVAEINGKRLRFFKTPLDDSKPDFPWHAVEDLYRCMKLPKSLRRHFPERVRAGRTIATAEGIVSIAPHCMAEAAIGAMIEVKQAPASFANEYSFAAVAAMNKLADTMPFTFPSEAYL
jgi:hypothetical protein